MAGIYVPPWLQISPESFVQAAQNGARIGAELAGQGTEANIAAGRNATALQEAQIRTGAEQSALDEQSQRAAQERALREWETRQQIIHQSAQIDAENQRNQNTVTGANTRAGNLLDLRRQEIDAANERAASALAERQKYGDSVLDIRREANRIAQERVDKPGSNPADFTTISEHKKEVPDRKSFSVTEPEIHNFFSKNTPGKSLTTTNLSDLVNLPRGSSIVTNTIPGTGSPATTISRRVPLLPPTPVATPSPFEGKRVRDKVTGKVGVISNGAFVPDEEDDNLDGDAASM
jgi:chorismate mutase